MKRIDYTVPYSEWEVMCSHCGHKGRVSEFPQKKCPICECSKFIHGDGRVMGLR